jgi:hypothetical protein
MRRPRSRGPYLAAALILTGVAALATGCAAAGTPAPVTSSSPAPPPTDTIGGKLLVLDEHAKGKTVTATVGTSVELILHNSYWDINSSSNPKVLAEIGEPTQLPATPTCAAGMGCNPVQATFTAMTPGTAVLSASRTSCGEALLCAPGQRHFQVTVVVTE